MREAFKDNELNKKRLFQKYMFWNTDTVIILNSKKINNRKIKSIRMLPVYSSIGGDKMNVVKYKFNVKDKSDKFCIKEIVDLIIDENLSEYDETIIVFEAYEYWLNKVLDYDLEKLESEAIYNQVW